jgi:hypothetical protein
MSTGIYNTSQATQDLSKKSFASAITRLMPNGNAPLFGLTSMLRTETAAQPEHGFFSKTMIFPTMKLNGAIADGTTTLFTVDSTTDILPGMIMRVNTTFENLVVDSVVSATQVQVTRGVGTVTPIAIADDVDLYMVGNAFEESSLRPQPLRIDAVRLTNLTQIFRNTWAISDTARATQVIAGETNVAENRGDAAAFHATDIESAIFFGQKSESTRNGNPFRTMDGLINQVSDLSYYPPSYTSTNVTTAGATTNWTQLEAALDPVFDQATDPKGGNERLLFVGGTAAVVINNIGRLNGTYELVDGQTNYGLSFKTLTGTRGKFKIIEHPLFNSNPTWRKMAVAVDLATFNLAYLAGRKTQSKEFNTEGNTAQDNGIDAVGGTLTTEVTALVKNVPANAVIYNLTAAAQG